MEQKKIFIKNEKDSMEFGKLLSRKLTAGSVIALTGLSLIHILPHLMIYNNI